MNNKIRLLLAFIILITINSCNGETVTPTENKEIPFSFVDPNGREISNWNKDISLQLIPDLITNTMKFGSTIDFEVDNISENKISFPKGYNLKIIDLTNGQKELLNSLIYNGPNLILESKNQKIGSNSLIGFKPSIQGASDRTLIIFVIGEKLNDDPSKNQLVGAYIDIVMHP